MFAASLVARSVIRQGIRAAPKLRSPASLALKPDTCTANARLLHTASSLQYWKAQTGMRIAIIGQSMFGQEVRRGSSAWVYIRAIACRARLYCDQCSGVVYVRSDMTSAVV